MKYIVTTTIHPPTEAILKFCSKSDWKFIIIGDLKTPTAEYLLLEKQYPNVQYLTPQDQEMRYKELSDILGWNTVERRNIGFIEAYNQGAEIIASVDDDNIPYEDWGKDLYVNKEIYLDTYLTNSPVFDPLSVTHNRYVWHRGYPIELLLERFNVKYAGRSLRKVLVQADLWNGDPDVDAIARIAYRPNLEFGITAPYCANVISPFNSQNTFLSREVFPCYAVLPFVGRMDDIWGGYLLQKTFSGSVIYNRASVYQKRNEQDVIKNLRDELIGYENTLKFIKGEYTLSPEVMKFYEVYKKQFKK